MKLTALSHDNFRKTITESITFVEIYLWYTHPSIAAIKFRLQMKDIIMVATYDSCFILNPRYVFSMQGLKKRVPNELIHMCSRFDL